MAHKKHILLAEDDRNISEIMKFVLEEEGYTTSVAGTKEELFIACEKELPQLILLDVRLHGDNGEDIAKVLRQRDNTAQIPFIMLSADSETQSIAQRVGANDFLMKPFELQDLLDIVKKHLR